MLAILVKVAFWKEVSEDKNKKVNKVKKVIEVDFDILGLLRLIHFALIISDYLGLNQTIKFYWGTLIEKWKLTINLKSRKRL